MTKSAQAPEHPFSTEQLERAFSPLLGNGSLQVHEVFAGNINTILKVENDGQVYGLRVRTYESVYRYEPDLIKEVFVLRLLQQGANPLQDATVADAFSQFRDARSGIVDDRAHGLPAVRYFDWSRRFLPWPYAIYEWVDGEPLWHTPRSSLYSLAGQALARLHHVRFSAFYADFLSIGVAPVSWRERFSAALAKEIAAAYPRLPNSIATALEKIEIPSLVDCTPCLVHNDFAPGNILVRDGRIAAIIDWDNAVIEAPHLDFVKMKYWTARGVASELAHDPELFSAFVDGYGSSGREIIGSSLFVLYEILWLLRVLNFERSKEEQGLARAPGYPAATVYEEYLGKVLSAMQ